MTFKRGSNIFRTLKQVEKSRPSHNLGKERYKRTTFGNLIRFAICQYNVSGGTCGFGRAPLRNQIGVCLVSGPSAVSGMEGLTEKQIELGRLSGRCKRSGCMCVGTPLAGTHTAH